MLMLRMYCDSIIPYHDAPGTKIVRPLVHKVYIDYCKAKLMFFMVETFLCIVVMEIDVLSKLKNWYFGEVHVMLSYDLIISHSQMSDQGPSAPCFYINYLTGGL